MKLMGKGKILRYLLFKEKVISMRGQLSAEMLIIITVILAIVIITFSLNNKYLNIFPFR
jgi:uncharacterized protein (UPF0333 family)